jgi:hypothetical protein
MATLVQWSVFARPASPSRKALSLPALWPIVYGTCNPVNRPLREDGGEMSRLGRALSIPFLETIIETLLTDTHAWLLPGDERSPAWLARWVAEHLVLWLYDLEDKASSWPALKAQVLASHQQGRRLRNAFLEAVPYITEKPDTDELRDIFAPDGSVSLWSALFAFNEHRFRMCDAVDTFEVAQELDSASSDVHLAEPTVVCEAALILSTRLREHAAINVLLKAGTLLSSSKFIPSVKSMLKRSLDKDRVRPQSTPRTNLTEVLVLVRTVISNMLSFRALLLRADKLQTISSLLRVQGIWTAARTLSFTALCCTDDKDFYDAVRAFEAAAVQETHSFMRLLASNDVLVAAFEDDAAQEDEGPSSTTLTEKAIRRSLLRLNLMVCSPRFEDKLWKGMTDLQCARVKSLFDDALPAALAPSCFAFAAFHSIFSTWTNHFKEESANEVLCRMLADKDAYAMLNTLLAHEQVSRGVLLDTRCHVLDLPNEFTLQQTWKNVQREGKRRMSFKKASDEDDGLQRHFFETIQFTENDLGVLVHDARGRGWEA